jgi:hypothetical protein
MAMPDTKPFGESCKSKDELVSELHLAFSASSLPHCAVAGTQFSYTQSIYQEWIKPYFAEEDPAFGTPYQAHQICYRRRSSVRGYYHPYILNRDSLKTILKKRYQKIAAEGHTDSSLE